MAHEGSHILRTVSKNVCYLAVSQSLRVLVRGVYTIAIARFLGAELFGIYNYGLAWYATLLSVAYLGLDLILSGQLGRRPSEAQEVIRTTFIIRLLVTLVAGMLCALVGVYENSPVSEMLFIFSWALCARSLAVWGSYVLTAKERSDRVFWQESVCRIGEGLVGFIALLYGAGLIEIVLIHAGFWSLQAVWVLSELSARGFLSIGKISRLHGVFGALPLILGVAGLLQIWIIQAPIVLFRWLGGENAQLGQAGFAIQMLSVLGGVSWAAVRGVTPALSRSVGDGRKADQTFMSWVTRLVIIGGGVGAIAAEVLGVPMVELLAGQGYQGTGHYLGVAVACLIPYTLGLASHQLIMAHERGAGGILLGTAIGAVTSTLLMVWAWQPGVLSVPFIALAGGLTAWCVTVGVVLSRVVPFNFNNLVLKPLAVAIPAWTVAVVSKPLGILEALGLSMLMFMVSLLVLRPISMIELRAVNAKCVRMRDAGKCWTSRERR